MKGETCIGIVFGVTNPSSHFFLARRSGYLNLGATSLGLSHFVYYVCIAYSFFAKRAGHA